MLGIVSGSRSIAQAMVDAAIKVVILCVEFSCIFLNTENSK